MGNFCATTASGNANTASSAKLFLATYDNTKDQIYTFTKAKVIKIYDGDTFWIAAEHNGEIVKFQVRLYGVDCAEIKSSEKKERDLAKQAKDYVVSKILDRIVDINVLNNKMLNGKKIREKYGRLLARIKVDGVDLSEEMIRLSYARSYLGGHKDSW